MSKRCQLICIYAVKCGRAVYVGNTLDFSRRAANHVSLLHAGKHHSKKLQAAFHQHGRKVVVVPLRVYHGVFSKWTCKRVYRWIMQNEWECIRDYGTCNVRFL